MHEESSVESGPDLHAASVLRALGDDACSVEDKVEAMVTLCGGSKRRQRRVLQMLTSEISRHNEQVRKIQQDQEELRELVRKLMTPPWHVGVYIGAVRTGDSAWLAEVMCNGTRRFVEAKLDLHTLVCGQPVFLSTEMNALLDAAPDHLQRLGELATVEQRLGEDVIVIRDRETQRVVQLAQGLKDIDLEPGTTVRWSPELMMVQEVMQAPQSNQFLLEDIPDTPPEQLAGADEARDRIIARFTLGIGHPEAAARYGLSQRKSLLLVGPPGCGKTLRMRLIASELSRRAGRRCRVAIVNGAELESPYVGETQQNIKRLFRSLRDYDGPRLLFLDEVEAIGRLRGSLTGQHSDRALATWLAEFDGLREQCDVAVVAATNRKDLVDHALIERLSAMEAHVGRPRMSAARAIFGVHLSESLPFRVNGVAVAQCRDELIELAVARLYSPNADNRIATLKLRDGSQREVHARELVSGRLIKQICDAASESAFEREVTGGETGIGRQDMEQALDSALDRMSSLLGVRNATSHLPDLPQDVDVVAVEQVTRKVRSDRYRLAAG